MQGETEREMHRLKLAIARKERPGSTDGERFRWTVRFAEKHRHRLTGRVPKRGGGPCL